MKISHFNPKYHPSLYCLLQSTVLVNQNSNGSNHFSRYYLPNSFLMVVRRSLRWIYTKILAKVQKCILSILAAGPTPQHIAFVMDGNRRYARSKNQKVHQGHIMGFYTLRKVRGLLMCTTVIRSYPFSDSGDLPAN